MRTEFRWLTKWVAKYDPLDPDPMYVAVRVLQCLTDEGWKDIPEIDELDLPKPKVKRQKMEYVTTPCKRV